MSNKYDDSEKGGFSYMDKLVMVSKDMMDPKEIGMTSKDDAIYEITGLKKPPAESYLSDWLTFEVAEVPVAVRARWARQDLKVVPTDKALWESQWAEEHKNEHRLQVVMRSGNIQARLDQTFTDPILGFAELMRQASDMLLQRYEQIKKENPRKPVKTREDIEAEKRAAAAGVE
jgi:hypothetical protein